MKIYKFEKNTTTARETADEMRNRIGQEDREILACAFKALDQDYWIITDTLDINQSTARGIINR